LDCIHVIPVTVPWVFHVCNELAVRVALHFLRRIELRKGEKRLSVDGHAREVAQRETKVDAVRPDSARSGKIVRVRRRRLSSRFGIDGAQYSLVGQRQCQPRSCRRFGPRSKLNGAKLNANMSAG